MAKLKSGFKGERAIKLPASVVEELEKDFFGRELHITDMGYYPQAVFHYRQRSKHEVSQFVLIYCVEGCGWFEVENKRREINQHQFIILPKGVAHSYGSNRSNPWTIYWLHFDGEKAAFFADGFDRPTDISPNVDSRIQERIKLFEEIFNTLSKGYSKNFLYYSITSLFYFLGSMKFLGEYRSSNSTGEVHNDMVEDTIHYMRENIERKLSLSDLAAHAALSPSHFSTLFKEKTHYSPLRYFAQLKMQVACHYLDFSDMRINQICPKVGFDDAFYFTRIFTQTMGISPSDYRKQKKG